MAIVSNQEFKHHLLEVIGNAALRKVIPKIESKTLKAAIRLDFDTLDRFVHLRIPHYWAVYYHDGRRTVRPKNATSLIWFKDIKNDPRVAGGLQYPIRKEQIKKLTKSQLKKARQLNQIIMAKKSGPAKGSKFFTDGMRGFATEIAPTIAKEFDNFIQNQIAGLSETSIAVLHF